MIQLQEDWSYLRSCVIDIHNIEMKARDFYLALHFEEEIDSKVQCLSARNHLDSCRILIRNMLKPEENKLISNYHKNFKTMVENLGRVTKYLNELEDETIGKLEAVEIFNDRDLPSSPKIQKYVNNLCLCFEHLVYEPLKMALINFENVDEDFYNKDRNLFCYLLFKELFHASESLGSSAIEKNKKSGLQQGYVEHSDMADVPEESEKEPEQKEVEDFIDLFKEEGFFDDVEDV